MKHEDFLPSGMLLADYEAKYNLRSKFYPQPDGSLKLAEEMCCNRFIFNPDGVEQRRKFKMKFYKENQVDFTEDYSERSRRRARNALFDLINCNKFDYFVTLTLNPKEIDRNDYKSVIKKLNTYLDNRVRRQGLYYVGVPELHKNGGFHFHFLVNDVLELVPSGTYIRPTGGKPVKSETLKRQKIDVNSCRVVYNIPSWKLGFTTAIETYGDIKAVANYVGKYITKNDKKIGGRWYYSGGKLQKPVFKYSRANFGEFVGDFGFSCEGGAFIIRRDFSSLL